MYVNKDMIAGVLNDKEFLTELLKLNNDIEIEKAFKERGIILPLEDLDEVCDIIHVYKSLKEGDKLNDNEIDKVVGGIGYVELKELIMSKIKWGREGEENSY